MKAKSSKPRPRGPVPVELDGAEVLAAVARFAVDPTCPECGGRAELLPGTGRAAVDVRVEHLADCPTVSAITDVP